MGNSLSEKWIVESYEYKGDPVALRIKHCESEKEAIKAAKAWLTDFPDEVVSIEYFRPSDGQVLYMDLDGNYDLHRIYL